MLNEIFTGIDKAEASVIRILVVLACLIVILISFFKKRQSHHLSSSTSTSQTNSKANSSSSYCYLYVCSKCTCPIFKSSQQSSSISSCQKKCSPPSTVDLDIEQVIQCHLKPEEREGLSCSSGRFLFKEICWYLEKHPNWKRIDDPEQLEIESLQNSWKGDFSSGQIDPTLKPLLFKHCTLHNDHNEPFPVLAVLPYRCLSMCDDPNCVAFRDGIGRKFIYQFGNLPVHYCPETNNGADSEHHHEAASNEQLLVDLEAFCAFYIDPSHSSYSKGKTRPNSLRKTLLARVPPVNP